MNLPDATSESTTNSVFQSDWWLDAVAPGRWSAVTAADEKGKVVGRWPYTVKSRYGFRISTQPPLTQTLGPWVDAESESQRGLSRSLELMEELLGKMPEFDYFGQAMHHGVACALPCHWRGYSLQTRYTHVLDDLPAAADIAYFKPNIRGDIKKAQRQLSVRSDLGVAKFIDVNRLSFQRQGLGLPYDPSTLERIHAACGQRGAGTMYFAEDAQQRIHAVLFVVRDSRTSYYLLGGADPALRSSGAQSLLVSHAIREAVGHSKVFDFEGSMVRSIGRFFQGFNPRVRPFVFVERTSKRFAPLLAMRQLRTTLRAKNS